MNRNEFLIVTSLSALVAVLLVTQIVFARMQNFDQARMAQANQIINQGRVCLQNLKQVALRTAQLSQQTGDQGLKDLLVRQQISLNSSSNQSSSGGSSSSPAAPPPAPEPASAPETVPTH